MAASTTTKRTPAKAAKAPAKRAVKAAPAKAAEATPVAATPAGERKLAANQAWITVGNRDLVVVRPTPEQLAVWQRTAKRFGGADPATLTEKDAARLLDRAMRIIESVLADEADHYWLEDQLLDKRITLLEAGDIMRKALEAFAAEKGSAAPKTGPAQRARRRR